MPITTRQAADRLNTSVHNISLGIRSGKYKAEKVIDPKTNRGIWMIDESSLDIPKKRSSKKSAKKAVKSALKRAAKVSKSTSRSKDSTNLLLWFYKHQDRFPGITLEEISELARDLDLDLAT